MGYLSRIPNRCGVIGSYNGTLNGLKILLFILASAWKYGNADKTRYIQYKEFRFLSGFYKNNSLSNIRSAIDETVSGNRGWLGEYANVKSGDVCIETSYGDTMLDTVNGNGINFYQIDMEDVSRFDTLFGLRMYLVYRRNYTRIANNHENIFRYTDSEFMSYCGCKRRNYVYCMYDRGKDDFQKITGVSIEIAKEKKDGYWNVRYVRTSDDYNGQLEGE